MAKPKKKDSKDPCLMQGCDRDVEMIAAGLCKRCYSWMRYNRDKTPAELQERRETLYFWEQRLDCYIGQKPRNKKRPLKVVK